MSNTREIKELRKLFQEVLEGNRVKWEYKVLPITDWNCSPQLIALGEEGWELVSIYPYYGWSYFKRPIEVK